MKANFNGVAGMTAQAYLCGAEDMAFVCSSCSGKESMVSSSCSGSELNVCSSCSGKE